MVGSGRLDIKWVILEARESHKLTDTQRISPMHGDPIGSNNCLPQRRSWYPQPEESQGQSLWAARKSSWWLDDSVYEWRRYIADFWPQLEVSNALQLSAFSMQHSAFNCQHKEFWLSPNWKCWDFGNVESAFCPILRIYIKKKKYLSGAKELFCTCYL